MAAPEEAPDLAGLDPRVLEAARRRGIERATEIQRLALPFLAGRSDGLLVAPTGTGKTEAALLPLLSGRLAEPGPGISILYVTPLRALNRDLEQRLVSLASELGLTAAVRHGDTPTAERARQARRPPDLLLTTPETLQLLLVGRRLREGLRNVRSVIVDELHELAPSDRGAQLALTLERLDAWAGRRIRRIGLSATIGNPEEVARFLAPAPRTVEVRVARQGRELELEAHTPVADLPPLSKEQLQELKADGPLVRALQTLEQEIRAHRTTLVFVNTRPTAEAIGARLRRLAPDLASAVHHGSLSREVREEAERRFRAGELRALVATSSLELGIDIGEVDHVVQFGSPHQVGRLVQRIGRSGHRVDRTIHGSLLALDEDDLEEAAVLARRAQEGEVEPTTWRTRNRLAAAQQIVASLRADGVLERAPLIARLRAAAPVHDLSDPEWASLVAYLEGLGLAREEGPRLRPGRGTLDRFYATLSLIPDERTYRLRDLATRRPIGTLDERFVLTQIFAQPEEIFLLHGQTWRVVEHREGELLVEAVNEIGREPRWTGEDLPVPFEVAQEIGRLRRDGAFDRYPLREDDRGRLATRRAAALALDALATDERLTITVNGRLALYGACFGSRTNETLALVAATELTDRLGARVDIVAVEPTWFVLELPLALDAAGLRDALAVAPAALEPLVERVLPGGLDYRWVFLTVARKFGAVPVSADPRELRGLDALLEASRSTPLGEETLEKTLHDRHDLEHARRVLARIAEGTIRVEEVPMSPLSEGALERLRWRVLSDTPPPTLLRALQERLDQEPLTLVCLRCGFVRTLTPARYREQRGSVCRLCHGALSGVVSARRTEDVDRLSAYARRKWVAEGRGPPGRRARRSKSPPAPTEALVRSAYTSAELVAVHGHRALWALAARGVGPDTARRLLLRPYRNDEALITELVRAERQYARTRAFWD